jgi:hypothetical protein
LVTYPRQSVDGSLTGYENLLIFAKLYGLPRQERERRIHEALDFMGLARVADRLVREYSGGMIRLTYANDSRRHHHPRPGTRHYSHSHHDRFAGPARCTNLSTHRNLDSFNRITSRQTGRVASPRRPGDRFRVRAPLNPDSEVRESCSCSSSCSCSICWDPASKQGPNLPALLRSISVTVR